MLVRNFRIVPMMLPSWICERGNPSKREKRTSFASEHFLLHLQPPARSVTYLVPRGLYLTALLSSANQSCTCAERCGAASHVLPDCFNTMSLQFNRQETSLLAAADMTNIIHYVCFHLTQSCHTPGFSWMRLRFLPWEVLKVSWLCLEFLGVWGPTCLDASSIYMVLMLGFSVQQQFSSTAELNMLCLIAMCRRPDASVRCQVSYLHTLCLRCPRQKSCQIFGSRTFLQVEKAEKP